MPYRRETDARQLDMFELLQDLQLDELGAAPVAGQDDPLAAVPVIQRLISADRATEMRPLGPASVFDLAAWPMKIASRMTGQHKTITRIERTDTGVRCTRILPQDTAEWQERERARRARQRPPKPTQRAKTMSEKMRAVLAPG